MRTELNVIFLAILILSTVAGLQGQSSQTNAGPAVKWTLPQGTTVKDAGPHTYRFTVDYNVANTRGEVTSRQRIVGDYSRGLEGGDVMWKNVAHADAVGPTAPFAPAQKKDFMEGFRYHYDLGSTMKPDFFKGFPADAVFERNLVWDTGMVEMFGQNYFANLKLNEPYHAGTDGDVIMPDVGTFHNRDIVLEWVGNSQRNGQECALILYKAFFNPLEITNGGINLKGRSDYWGEIWVSLADKQIQYATLQEVVVGELKLPGQDALQTVNIFRIGALEPVGGK